MKSRFKAIPSLFFLVLLVTAMASCELINPEEQIPAFLRIDSISLATQSDEGNPVHKFTDAWVYENEKLVGIYSLPAIVPILKNGSANIRIRGGIKLNGAVGTRIPLLYTKDFLQELELFPDSILHINPTLTFKNDVSFAWLEDFDGVGLSMAATTLSSTEVERVGSPEALDGSSLKLAISASDNVFECRTISAYELPDGGVPVILEFSYKCNHALVVGLYSYDASGSFQIPIIVLNPTENWNHIYVNLTDVVSSNTNFINHRPFFGYLRNEGFEGEIVAYLDNIRLMH